MGSKWVEDDFELTVRLTQTVDRWYSQGEIQQNIMVYVLVQDEIAWLQGIRILMVFMVLKGLLKDSVGLNRYSKVFWLLESETIIYAIYSLIYPIESGDLISMIPDLQEYILGVNCTLYRYSKCTDCLIMWEFDISHVRDEISHSDAKVYWFAFLYINFGLSYISAMSQFELIALII